MLCPGTGCFAALRQSRLDCISCFWKFAWEVLPVLDRCDCSFGGSSTFGLLRFGSHSCPVKNCEAIPTDFESFTFHFSSWMLYTAQLTLRMKTSTSSSGHMPDYGPAHV